MKQLYLLLTVFFGCLNFTFAQPGTLDPAFGNKGIVKTDFSLSKLNSRGSQVLIQPDGSLLELVESIDGLTVLVKILPDGSRDLNYGTNGYSGPLAITSAVASMQTDGKVIVAGSSDVISYSSTPYYQRDLNVARFNTNGSLDSSFDEDGRLTTSFGIDDIAKSITIQDNGNIIVISVSDEHLLSLSAFNTVGTPDITYNGNGRLSYSIEGYQGAVIQNDGKIVMADYSFSLGGSYIFRLNTDGTIDGTFNSTTFSDVGIQTISLQHDGKVLIAGYTQIGSPSFFLERFNSDGSADDAFGTDGIVTTDFSSGGSVPTSVTIGNNGKIVLTGYTLASGKFIYTIARYDTDGNLDKTLSGDGIQITPLGDDATTMYLTSAQSNEKFLVAYTDNNNFAVTRFNSNGSFDDTFGGHGMLNEGIVMGSTLYLASALQPDGKLVTAGYTFNGKNNDFALARYNTDGSLDATFSNDGKQVTDVMKANDTAYAVLIQNNGKIIVAGSAIARYRSDGSKDVSFGHNGIITSGNWKSAALQSDGKLVVAGSGIARFNTDGSPDLSFGNNGIVSGGHWYAIAMQADDKVVVAGGVRDFEIARFNTDGSSDNSFSEDGFESTHIYENPGAEENLYIGYARAVVIQGDGKIVLAGDWHNNYRGYTSYFGLARYNPDGSLDDSFGQDGKLLSIRGYATSLVLQQDGKIIAGGSSNDENQIINNTASDFALARYNTDGSLDPEFNGSGFQITPVSSAYNIIQSLAFSSNRLYATGHGKFPNNLGIVARYVDIAGGVVPLTLIRLDATSKGIGRLISWITSNENNVDRYEIERSTGSAYKFERIGFVDANNHSSNSYSYIDNDILQEDICYYRLKILDADGKATYSKIVSVRNVHAGLAISIYPNPANQHINISLTEAVQNANMSIYNSSGKIIFRRSNVSGQNFQFNISVLPSGFYSVTIEEKDKIFSKKFMKE